jgi:putative transposase
MVYIDTNMIRAGVVRHPSMWFFSGCNEIQEPRRNNILVDYERLQGLFGTETYDELKSSHRGWIEEYLGDGRKGRQNEWTDSIAVGSKAFIEKATSLMGFKARGRDIVKSDEGYHLREEAAPYMAFFEAEKGDIGPENTCFWNINT